MAQRKVLACAPMPEELRADIVTRLVASLEIEAVPERKKMVRAMLASPNLSAQAVMDVYCTVFAVELNPDDAADIDLAVGATAEFQSWQSRQVCPTKTSR